MRPLVASLLIGFTLLAAHMVPRPRYEGTGLLSRLSVPFETPHWKSRDVSGILNVRDKRYAFLSKIFARQYQSDLGESLLFLILDTSNFHNPRICYEGSGYFVRPLPDYDIALGDKKIEVKALFMEKGRESTLVVYWMTLDMKNVDWAEGKIKEFFLNLSRQKRAGLMGRLDIPTTEDRLEQALGLSQDFIKVIGQEMSAGDADALFGK